MEKMNERIVDLIDALNIKKSSFAERLCVSQAYVSQMCSGVRMPSDRTISDICREFDVNELWLRTGDGAMLRQRSRYEELSGFFGGLLKAEPDFRHRLISVLSRLDADEWQMLERIARELAEDKEKADP